MNKGWTFQSLIDGKMTVTAYCHDAICNGSSQLPLGKLRDKYGPDAPAIASDLVDKLKCSKCRGRRCKGVGLIYSPASNADKHPFTPLKNLHARSNGE